MSSGIDDFLDHVDEWKFKLNEKLKRMSSAQRRAFWDRIHEEARQRGLPMGELPKPEPAKPQAKRPRRTA